MCQIEKIHHGWHLKLHDSTSSLVVVYTMVIQNIAHSQNSRIQIMSKFNVQTSESIAVHLQNKNLFGLESLNSLVMTQLQLEWHLL
jgi:hypothetical protein